MIINASEYGIKPDKENGKELSVLFKKLSEIDEEKTVVFEAGDYFVDAENCDTEMLYSRILPSAVQWRDYLCQCDP